VGWVGANEGEREMVRYVVDPFDWRAVLFFTVSGGLDVYIQRRCITSVECTSVVSSVRDS
jgi:hypothetical protein